MDANGDTHPIIDAYQAATSFAEYRAASALLDAALDAGTVDDDTESVIDACAQFTYDRLAASGPDDLERHRVTLCDRRAPVTFEPHNPNPVRMPAAQSVSGIPHRIIAMPGDRQWWQ